MGLIMMIKLSFMISLALVLVNGDYDTQESLYLKNIGVLIEPIGIGSLNPLHILTKVAIKVDIQELRTKINHCTKVADQSWMAKLNEIINAEFDEIWSIIPSGSEALNITNLSQLTKSDPHSLSSRPKRSITVALFLCAGAMLTAFGFGLWYKLSVDDAIQEVENHADEIERMLRSSIESHNKLEISNTNTLIKVEDLILKSHKDLYRDICEVTSSFNYQLLKFLILESFVDLKEAIKDSMRSYVTPFILSTHHLTELLKNNPLFAGTIYLKDPASFFTLSESLLYKVDKNKRLMYYFIKTPRILEEDLSAIYQTYNLGWNSDSVRYKYSIPEYFIMTNGPQGYHGVEISLKDCKTSVGLWSCTHNKPSLTLESKCITHLITKKYNFKCDMYSISEKSLSPAIETTRSGLFFTGVSEYSYHTTIHNSLSDSERLTVNPTQSHFIPYSDFENLFINGMYIRTKRSAYFVETYNINVNSLFINIDMNDELKQTTQWINLNQSILAQQKLIQQESLLESVHRVIGKYHSHHIMLLYIVVLILLMITMFLSYRSYRMILREKAIKAERIKLAELKMSLMDEMKTLEESNSLCKS